MRDKDNQVCLFLNAQQFDSFGFTSDTGNAITQSHEFPRYIVPPTITGFTITPNHSSDFFIVVPFLSH